MEPAELADSERAAIIAAADEAFPDGLRVSLSLEGAFTRASTDIAKGERLLDLLGAALAKRPRDTELLMAKAGALARLMQMKSAEDTLDEVLRVDPAHFDATMKKRHWDDWRLPFDLPSWHARRTSVEPLFGTKLGALEPMGTRLYLARTGLELGAVVVQSTDGLVFDRGVGAGMRGMVQVKLVESPYGPIAPYYVLLEDDPAKPFVREAFLTVSRPRSREESPDFGIWLLHRLAKARRCWLVFATGTEVVWNRLVELPEEQAAAIERALPDYEKNPPEMNANQNQRAVQWYTENSDFSEIRFPGAAPRAVVAHMRKLVPDESPVVAGAAPRAAAKAPAPRAAERAPARARASSSGCAVIALAAIAAAAAAFYWAK